MPFLRKQQAKLLCAYYGVPAEQGEILGYFLDSRLRGNDTLGLTPRAEARRRTGQAAPSRRASCR